MLALRNSRFVRSFNMVTVLLWFLCRTSFVLGNFLEVPIVLFGSEEQFNEDRELTRYYKRFYNEDTLMCYDVHHNAHHFASTFTPHKVIANFDTEPYKCPGCVPVKMWVLVRHGSRTPKKKYLQAIRNKLPKIRHHILYNHYVGKGELNDEVISLFKDWSAKLPTSGKLLTKVGEKEMHDLAKRFQMRFPQLIPDVYSSLHFKFRHTITSRTKASAYHFAGGLFGYEKVDDIKFVDSHEDNFILKFYKFCKKWKKQVKQNPKVYEPHKKFIKGPEMAECLITVSNRLGLNYTVSYEDAHSMLLSCAAEIAWDNTDSPWCHIFSKRDLEVLEYSHDVQKYHLNAFASEINYKQACPIMKDLIHYLRDESSWPQVQFLFSHSGAVMKFTTALGLYRDDEHLTSQLKVDRNWKTSNIDAFASNFAFILYRCDDGVDKVLTLHQERPVILPGCDNIYCPLETFTNNYDDFLECNFKKLCKHKKSKPVNENMDEHVFLLI